MFRLSIVLLVGLWGASAISLSNAAEPAAGWRSLPLIKDGTVHPDWVQIGYGGFAVVDGALRTVCEEKGMGLLIYKPKKFGDCQIRIVFRAQDAKSNAGVFVRIDDGILDQLDKRHPPAERDAQGKLTPESLQAFKDASRNAVGPWYAVHHGYEVQIREASDALHRTGAIYSLGKAAEAPAAKEGAWRTMIITLQGDRILVEMDGKQVTNFDPAANDVPPRKEWYEPSREAQRPQAGYIGLQNHDPGDVVDFKEISVRPWKKNRERPSATIHLPGRFDQQLQSGLLKVPIDRKHFAAAALFHHDHTDAIGHSPILVAALLIKVPGSGFLLVRHGNDLDSRRTQQTPP